MSTNEHNEENFSFTSFFSPFTPIKAIHFIIVLGFIVYGNGLINPLIGDDFLQIIKNPAVHSLSNIFSYFSGSTFYDTGVYFRPFLSTSYALIYSLFGASPFWYHFLQLILHIANAVFVYLVLRYFLKNITSFFLSLIFLVHPINSQSVYYIAALNEPLFFFFGIVSFWIILRYNYQRHRILAVLFLLFSLFSKESGVLFFISFCFYFILYHKKYLSTFFLYSAVPLVLYFSLRFHALGFISNPHTTPIDDLPLLERVLHIPAMIYFYVSKFFYPDKLSYTNNWSFSTFNFNNFTFPLIIFCLFVLFFSIAGYLIKKSFSKESFTNYLFFAGIFILWLSAHMQIIPLDMTTSETWFYVPIVGILGLLGIIYETLLRKVNKTIVFIFVLIVVSALSLRTFYRSYDWRDTTEMYYKDLSINDDNYAAKINIALALYVQGRFDEAKPFVEASIKRYPRVISYNLLGLLDFEQGEYMQAKQAYSNSFQLGESQTQYNSMAQLGLFYGNPDENIAFIQKGLQKYPTDPYLWQFLAILYYRQGKFIDAKTAIDQSYALLPADQMTVTIREGITTKRKLKIDHHGVTLE